MEKTFTLEQFQAWGRKGGKSKSPEKLAAIAKNAKLGGRPKKKDLTQNTPSVRIPFR